jgi:toxin ParE1/3/4
MDDLEIIHDFISRESPKFAQKTIESLFERVRLLIKFPKMGRYVPEYQRKVIRELIEGNYRIFYKVVRANIYIIRVHHSSRKTGRRRVN